MRSSVPATTDRDLSPTASPRSTVRRRGGGITVTAADPARPACHMPTTPALPDPIPLRCASTHAGVAAPERSKPRQAARKEAQRAG